MRFQMTFFAAIVAVGMAAPGMAAAQSMGAAPFAACPSLDTLESLGEVPEGTSFPCLGIATFGRDSDASGRGAVVARSGAVARFDLGIVDGSAVLVPNERALWDLVGAPELLQFYPDRRVHAFAPGGKKGKPGGGSSGGGGTATQTVPSGVHRIGADTVWGADTGLNVRVAIVDTGIDFNHTDLAPADDCFFAASYSSCQDDNGHGTHVAGIVAALDNDQDVVGVAPDATVVAVKVLDANGSGLDSEVLDGLGWVLAHSIDVVNMSLGETAACNGPWQTAIDNLTGAGIVVVVAAGNDYTETVSDMTPAGCAGVISVASTVAEDGSNKCIFASGAINRDTASYFTTNEATIAAPGGRSEDWNRGCGGRLNGILSLNLGGGTTTKSGTSMAAPHVAGVAALLLGAGASWDQVACDITSGSEVSGSAPYTHPISGATGTQGSGILSAPGALASSCP